MSASRLVELRQGLRRRNVALGLAVAMPWLAVVAAAVWRFVDARIALVVLSCGLLVLIAALVARARRIGLEQVVRGLDTAAPTLEDSSDLLLRDASSLSPLQRMQRARVGQRVATMALPDLGGRWPRRRIVAAWACAALVVVAIGLWPKPTSGPVGRPAPAPPAAMPATATRIVSVRIDIEAPAYMALAARSESQLDLSAPAGSRLRWRLQFDSTPGEVTLAFHDGSTLSLARAGDAWLGERELLASTLYRIVLADAPALDDDRLHRLDALPDEPPRIRVLEPERTLTVLDGAQRTWPLAFEVSDDHGIGSARLHVTLAQGSGEQISVREREIVVRPEAGNDPRNRRYRQRLDLGALGFVQGDDLIVRLAVSDNRSPQPNLARSASFILRWPADVSVEAEGVEGIVQKVLPAYFRSQRQIIIDTEALLAARATLDRDTFVARSDTIGVDQKILRLRYGQFLGEEFESNAGGAAEKPVRADDDEAEADAGDARAGALPEGHTHDDGHDHAGAAFGDAAEVVAEYAHVHDHAEAATLLDPETKRILKAALGEMWQAEMHLRLGEPDRALPFENRALDYIKQVQQASRIYLARVGLELPPVDEARRLTGAREGLRDRRATLAAAERSDAPLVAFTRALAAGDDVDPAPFEEWLRTRDPELPDSLDVIAALDRWRREPGCADCRERLLDSVWPLLPTPATGTRLRPRPDPAGAAYLDALRAQEPR